MKNLLYTYSIAWENRSVHGLGEWCAKSSSFYRKTVAKAWNWYQRWVSKNGTQITAWNIPSGKTGLLSQMAVVPVIFPLQLKKACCAYFPTGFLVNNLNFLVLPILSLPGRVKIISRPVRPNDLTARLQGHRDESTCRKSLRKSLILVNPASREASKSRQQHKFCVFPNPALCFAQIRDPEGTLPDPVYSEQYRCLNSPLFHLFFHRAC